MIEMKAIQNLKREVREVLESNILPYWLALKDEENGGFYGRVSGDERLDKDASKGAVMQSRILWTFSSAYRVMGDTKYLEAATHAKRFIIDKLYDHQYGGIYWEVSYDGTPIDSKKQIYALGFTIYGLSEYHRATGDQEALDYAQKLFFDIEQRSFDIKDNGYFEAFKRDWSEIGDMRLSDKDMNERKTMNTHLHILEPYTNLYRVWKNPKLEAQLKNLVNLFCNKFYNTHTKHCIQFFNDQWETKHNIISYGHDIEASWLIHEAALVLKDETLLSKAAPYVKNIAEAGDEGLLPGGGMIYEMNVDTQEIDSDRHWWVQAEAMVGYLNLYQHFNDEEAAHKAISCWKIIKDHLLDNQNGEWHWSLKSDGTINKTDDKAGFWKCPYHNSRMCIELIERF